MSRGGILEELFRGGENGEKIGGGIRDNYTSFESRLIGLEKKKFSLLFRFY